MQIFYKLHKIFQKSLRVHFCWMSPHRTEILGLLYWAPQFFSHCHISLMPTVYIRIVYRTFNVECMKMLLLMYRAVARGDRRGNAPTTNLSCPPPPQPSKFADEIMFSYWHVISLQWPFWLVESKAFTSDQLSTLLIKSLAFSLLSSSVMD